MLRGVAVLALLVVISLAAWFVLTTTRETGVDALPVVGSVGADAIRADAASEPTDASRAEISTAATMPAPVAATIEVVDDATLEPIAGALARLARSSGSLRSTEFTAAAGVATDARGIASFAAIEDAKSVVVTHAGYCARWAVLEQSTTRVRLFVGATLFGRVLEEDSRRPIAGARIWNDIPDKPALAHASVVTDAGGAYRLEGLRMRDELSIRIAIPQSIPVDERMSLSTSGLHERDFLVDMGGTLRGRAVDATTGAPIAGASAWCGDAGDVSLSGDDGRFEVRRVWPERVVVDVRKDGWVGSVLYGEGLPVDLRLERVFPMIPECRIDITVVDDEGAVVKGASCFLHDPVDAPAEEWRLHVLIAVDPDVRLRTRQSTGQWQRTDEFGRVSLGTFRPWTDYRCCVRDPYTNGVVERMLRFGAPGEVRRERFVLRRGQVAIQGRVTWEDRKPTGEVLWRASFDDTTDVIRGEAQIEPDGTYRCFTVPAGRIELRVRLSRGDMPNYERTDDLGVVAAGASLHHDFALEIDRRRIDGVVVHAVGEEPVPSIALVAERANSNARVETVSDAHGRFVFELPDDEAASWWLLPRDPQWRRYGVSASGGSNAILLRILPEP